MEVSAVSARARTLYAAAVLAAAVAVYAVWRERDRRLRRAAVSERLMAGRVQADNAALRHELDRFRRRIEPVLAQPEPVVPAAEVPGDALAHSESISAPLEGGPR